jgi:hypothetical protein
MPEYVLNRTYTLRTTSGVISFQKGTPTWVPPYMERDAAGIGAQRVDGKDIDPLGEEEVKVPEIGFDERQAQIRTAFELIVETNDAKDFTGQGVPTVKAVEKITGIRNVERGELLELWQAFRTKDE